MRFLIFLLFFSTGKATTSQEADQVRQARLEQNRAMEKGDVELAASFWTEDVTLRRGLGTALAGKEAYRNVDANGQMHFPAFSAQATEFLLKRNIAGIAIDTLSPDCLDVDFTVHKLILGAGKYIIENIADSRVALESETISVGARYC